MKLKAVMNQNYRKEKDTGYNIIIRSRTDTILRLAEKALKYILMDMF